MNFVVHQSEVVHDKVHGLVRIEVVHDKVDDVVGEDGRHKLPNRRLDGTA